MTTSSTSSKPEVSVVIGRRATVASILNEDLPRVGLTDEGLLGIGDRYFEEGIGGDPESFNEEYYTHQLIQALAAIKYFRDLRNQPEESVAAPYDR